MRSACRSEPGHRFAQRFDQFGSCGPARRGHPVGACWLLHYDGGDIGAEPPTSASRPAPPLGQGPWSSDEPKVRAGVALAFATGVALTLVASRARRAAGLGSVLTGPDTGALRLVPLRSLSQSSSPVRGAGDVSQWPSSLRCRSDSCPSEKARSSVRPSPLSWRTGSAASQS